MPPTIPTSFVPHTASSPARRFRSEITGVFGYFAYGVLVIVFLLAIGVFSYGRILAFSKVAKDVELKSARAAIVPATIENFVRLRDRLDSSTTLIGGHDAFSGFFSAIEKLMPSTVRFTTLHLALADAGAAKMEGAGVAKSFNALAAASNAFASDGRIKDAIFSNISVNKDSSVSFAISAMLDPDLLTFVPTAQLPTAAAPVAPSPASASATSSAPLL